MVMLKKGDCPSLIDLSWVDFRVLVLDVSFEWHTKEMGQLLGHNIGPVPNIDASRPSMCLRILVSLSLFKSVIC